MFKISQYKNRTKKTKYLKYVFIILASVVLVYMVFPFVSNNNSSKINIVNENSETIKNQDKFVILNPKFYGTDKNHKFSLVASRATENFLKELILKNIVSRIEFKNESKLDIFSDEGVFLKEEKSLKIDNRVKLLYNKIYELVTMKLFVSFNDGLILCSSKIKINSPNLYLQANSFKASMLDHKLIFLGDVKVVFNE